MHKITVKQTVEREVKYLRVEAGVRYWDDGEINGVKDDETEPKMPFACISTWRPLIDMDTGKIVDWPAGVSASVHYKVCDNGVYTLLDAEKNAIVEHDGYVPAMLCPKGNGYGDYIIMDIGPDGAIANWRVDFDKFEADED